MLFSGLCLQGPLLAFTLRGMRAFENRYLALLWGFLLAFLAYSCTGGEGTQENDSQERQQEENNNQGGDDGVDDGNDGEADGDDDDEAAGPNPVVSIESPEDGGVYSKNQTFVFQAQVADAEDSPQALTLEWRSNVFGVLNNQSSNSQGVAYFVLSSLMAGNHTLTLSATDSDGNVGTDSIAFAVYDPNNLVADFSLEDVNPTSATYEEFVSPRDYLGRISAWYFGHST